MSFYLDDALFGINILLVQELNRLMEYTPVPDGPEYIRGLLNLRGQVITVFDLGKRLGLEKRTITPRSRNIVLKTDRETAAFRNHGLLDATVGEDAVAFLVDRVGDVVEVEGDQIESSPANIGKIATEFVTGVVELPEDLLVLLTVERVVSDGSE